MATVETKPNARAQNLSVVLTGHRRRIHLNARERRWDDAGKYSPWAVRGALTWIAGQPKMPRS